MANQQNIDPYKIKPGEVRNPKGKPKGAKTFKSVLQKYLKRRITDDELGKMVSTYDALMLKLIRKALDPDIEGKGLDLKAIHEILNRVEGLPKQEVDQNINGNITLVFGKEFDDV